MFRNAAAGALLAVVAAGSALADTMLWEITSEYPYRVQIEFFSQDRPHSWPGGGQAYDLNDYATHTFELSCQAGELVCYGAWITGGSDQYWGSGPDDAYGCEDCCAYCGDRVEPVTLTE